MMDSDKINPVDIEMAYRILLVDDNTTNLNLTGKLLQWEGFDVETAESGTEALRKVSESRPDLALLDVMMPDMNGFELCRNIRQIPGCAEVPIIMLTASTDEEDRIQSQKSGATCMLVKPLDLDALKKIIIEHS